MNSVPLADWMPLVAILAVGVFVQSATGFGAGLLAIPMLLIAGFDMPSAQAALMAATLPQNVWGIHRLREHWRPRECVRPAVLRTVALPFGLATLAAIQTLPDVRLRQIVGGAVLAATVAVMVCVPRPRPAIDRRWGWVAFTASGFFQGVVGMGGPPMVLWVAAHDWDTARSRSFLFTIYLFSTPIVWAMLYVGFGPRIVTPLVVALLSTPGLILATAAGLWAGDVLGRRGLRRVTYGMLIAIGVSGLAAPWWG